MNPSPWDLIIGGDPNHPQPQTIVQVFEGEMEQVRISKAVRYSRDFRPAAVLANDADVMVLLHCNEGSGSTTYDSSGDGVHAALEGATWQRRRR